MVTIEPCRVMHPTKENLCTGGLARRCFSTQQDQFRGHLSPRVFVVCSIPSAYRVDFEMPYNVSGFANPRSGLAKPKARTGRSPQRAVIRRGFLILLQLECYYPLTNNVPITRLSRALAC
ncbi:MAG: hypothetical protein ACI906_002554 [Candidatus Latescibacterota bacterium]|jgi:hypothetical protein